MKRFPRPPARILFATLVCLLLMGAAFAWRTRSKTSFRKSTVSTVASAGPRVMLWAWERPEDLSFIDPQSTGVAYLAKTVTLNGERVSVRPRLQPLKVPPGATVLPVVRVEADHKSQPKLTAAQLSETVSEIAELARVPNVKAVQIDFDATSSQRDFYRSLLQDLRASLPAQVGISITALGSWCAGDRWLEDLPVDETVPMLFRMGADRNSILSNLAADGFASARCRGIAGISTDEPIQTLPPVDKLYIFNPEPWTRESFIKVMETQGR